MVIFLACEKRGVGRQGNAKGRFGPLKLTRIRGKGDGGVLGQRGGRGVHTPREGELGAHLKSQTGGMCTGATEREKDGGGLFNGKKGVPYKTPWGRF